MGKKTFAYIPTSVAILTTAGTFIVDILTPLGIMEWIFYIIPTITTYWIKRDHLSWIAAAACSVLILAGIPLSPSGIALHLSIINRTAGICMLWMFAYIVYLAKNMEQENARHVASLERTQRELRNVLERISDGFVAFDAEMNYTYVNRHGGTMLGRAPEELTGKNYWKEYPEARGTPFANAYLKAMETQAPIMIDEHYEPWDRWFENRIYPSPEGLSVFFTDISERMRVENKLRENEARLRLSVSAANVGLWDWDLKTNRVYYSPEWKNQIGYRDDEIGDDFSEWQNRVHPDDLQPTLAKIQTFIANPKGKHEAEFRFHHKDGTYRWIYSYADVIHGEDGKPARMLGCHIDITGRKRAEEELRSHRQLLETVVNYIPASVSLLRGSDLRVQLINPAYQAIAPGKEMIGKTWDELWEETGQNFTAICRRVLETGKTHEVVDELNMIRRTPDGPVEPAYFSWALHRVRLPGDEGWGLLGTAWETTRRKETEDEIKRSREQLRALTSHLQNVIEEERARIAREIHDDIGQIFTATKMNLTLFSQTIDTLKEQKQKKEIAQEIDALIGLLDHGVRSIRKIVRDLRPEVLETMGLLAGIEWQANEFQKRTKIGVTMNLQKIKQALDKQQTVALFRIVQESLTNVARHSAATKVMIELMSTPTELRLKIADNGKGVPENIFTLPSSFGILAMRERIAALGGTFSIAGKAGEGTVVEAVLNQKT